MQEKKKKCCYVKGFLTLVVLKKVHFSSSRARTQKVQVPGPK